MRSWESAQEVEFETRFGSEGLGGEHLSSTRIVRWLILKKKKLGCQAACLSLHLCACLFQSFVQFFLVHTSCSQESLGFYSPLKLPLNQTQGQSRLEVIF